MVYGVDQDEVRHERWPLRLGSDGTDEVVRSHQLRCTHFDAVRFFTPQAIPLNAVQPTRDEQLDLEQPGCLHAGMDVYKWALLRELLRQMHHSPVPRERSEARIDEMAPA